MNAVPADSLAASLQAGSAAAAGRDLDRRGRELRGVLQRRLARRAVPVRRQRRARARAARVARAHRKRLARLSAGAAWRARPRVRLACARSIRSARTACVTTRTSCCSIRMRARWRASSNGIRRCSAICRTQPTEQASNTADSAPYKYKARVIDGGFDWSEDRPPAVPWRDTVIYELHVKGFTKLHPPCPSASAASFWVSRTRRSSHYLKHLGVTAVELLPVQAFVPEQFLVERGLVNYWGYSSLAWFAPASGVRASRIRSPSSGPW